MKTYILQYWYETGWVTVTDRFYCNVEFLSLEGARSIAIDLLKGSVGNYPSSLNRWRVKDSNGNEYEVE